MITFSFHERDRLLNDCCHSLRGHTFDDTVLVLCIYPGSIRVKMREYAEMFDRLGVKYETRLNAREIIADLPYRL